ncbi:MAG TPA: molybdopterin-dependent oxidoreductase, partial [Steroidobacteraceae bacterium]
MPNRRSVLQGAVSGLLLTGAGLGTSRARADLPQGALDSALLEALPGKKPLIKRAYRPPNYETPLAGFASPITPNDQFFVRWHESDIPEIDADTWTLKVSGDGVAHELTLSLAQLKQEFEAVEIVAVCQCAGNRRGLSDPHVPGVQWGSGAIGNARWKGARLRDILTRAGMKNDTVEVAYHGGDRGPLDATPAFIKSLPSWKA